jgi:HEAT repeat protein
MTDQPAKTRRTWLPMALWTAGILLLLGLAWFAGAVVVPVWRVSALLQHEQDPGKVVERLGGPDRAAWALRIYSRLPERVAPAGENAVLALGWCGEKGMPTLTTALGSPRPETRRAAAQAMANGPFFEEREQALPALIKALEDEDNHVRSATARAIARMGPRATTAIPALTRALTDADVNVPGAAARALGAIGPDAAPSVPALRKALGDKSQTLSRYAAIALGGIGPGAREALPEVLELLAGPDQVLRADAILGVAGITRDGDTVKRAYSVVAGSGGPVPDDLYLYEIGEEMHGIGDGAVALAPLMEKLLADKNANVRAFASRILRRIPGHENAPEIPFPHGGAPGY